MRKCLLLLAFLVLVLVPVNAQASSSVLTYGPTGTITTPYPTITIMIHAFNSYVLLNETTMYLGAQKLNFTAAIANQISLASPTTDYVLSYTAQSWLVPANYTVLVDAKILELSSMTKVPLKLGGFKWWFIVTYDAATKLMFGMNSTLVSTNSTLYGLRHDYDATIGQWLPTLQTMNNTMHYWNGTIQNTYNLIATIQGMFQSPNGSIYLLLSDAKNYIAWGLFGLAILLLAGFIAIALIVRRTRGGYESQPPVTRSVGPPSYPTPPRLQPQVSVRQPTGTMAPCPNCGHQNRQQAIYCANCKNKLIPEEAQPS